LFSTSPHFISCLFPEVELSNIYKLPKRWAKGSIFMLLFGGVPECLEEIVMGLLKKCSSKAPKRGEGREVE
jgi:hypothetical protein